MHVPGQSVHDDLSILLFFLNSRVWFAHVLSGLQLELLGVDGGKASNTYISHHITWELIESKVARDRS